MGKKLRTLLFLKGEYDTPLLLRLGFLHSYRRTIPVIIGWLALNILIYWQMNVLEFLVGDVWTYMFLPLILIVIHIARTAVSGYDDLFGIFDDAFDKELKLYQPLDRPKDTINQERIRKIFSEDRFYFDFKKNVRKRLFGGYERIFLLMVIIAIPFITYFYFDAYLVVGVYGSFEPVIWLYVYIISNLVIGLLILASLASLVWIVFSMIMSISQLEEYKGKFKIANYIDLLKGGKIKTLNLMMGYDTFYEETTAIGSFIYRLTLRALLIMVAYALNLIFFSFLNSLNLGLGVYGIGLAIIGIAVFIFVWPQLGLHNVLTSRKKEIMRELVLKKDMLDTEVMIITSQSIVPNRAGAALEETKLKVEASERIASIHRNVKERSTWGFEITTLIQFVATSAVPLVTTILSAFFG